MEFNSAQSQAAVHVDGPCLVLAGPGSGKTAVITKRTEYLITRSGISQNHILVVTFTKAAAVEMRQRFEQMTDRKYPGVSFGTFHAVFFQILKHAYHYTAANIAREETRYQFMREIIARNHIECDNEAEFVSNILGEISVLKNSDTALENYYPIHCGKEVFSTLYQEYSRYMSSSRLIDFDDILIFTKELLEQRPDIRKAWQQKFRYIMVDEFQDINQLQYQIVRMLAGDTANLFVVGDDDQSIYRFRGSRPELMLNFPKDYEAAQIIRLSVNYRCPKEVVQKAGRLIGHNKNRFEKQIESAGIDGCTFQCRRFENVRQENKAIIDLIRGHVRRGGSCRQIAVLYRTNVQPWALTAKLMEYNIPFWTKEQVPNLYEHWIAQDILAYFRLALGSRARKDFLKIMNRPVRYLSRESLPDQNAVNGLDASNAYFDAWQEFYKEQSWMAERIERLEYDLKVLARIRPYAAVNYIRKSIGYDDFLCEYARQRQIPLEDLLETLEELQESTKEYQSLEEWMAFTEAYTEELKQKQQTGRKQPDKDGVAVMTLHGSKGLEYDLVIIPDLNEGLIPYKKAVLEAELEEERRMLYVGMTRAKRELHMYYVRTLRSKCAEPSRFLAEIYSASSASSSKRLAAASYSSSASIFSRDGFPSSSSK